MAGYRIDMAVRHPDKPGSYAIGIECDGAAYHSSRTARDRDRVARSSATESWLGDPPIWGLSWGGARGAGEAVACRDRGSDRGRRVGAHPRRGPNGVGA
ncbi:hypothetical protein GS924_24980 [Rhodococcus hoagii]|nr:hypothetical protein [Prescottella equi]